MTIYEKNTINNLASLYVPLFREIQFYKLSKSTRVVVINGFCISESFQDWAKTKINNEFTRSTKSKFLFPLFRAIAKNKLPK